MSFRYTPEEIDQLCEIPAWTDANLDIKTSKIHDNVPLARKIIVNQCLFWTDVVYRFKSNLHTKRRKTVQIDPSKPLTQTTVMDSQFTVGVIGCGSIGSKFVRQLLKRNIVSAEQIKIASRTPSRSEQRCGLEVSVDNSAVASSASILFLFVLPFHFRSVSLEIREAIKGNQPLIVSTLAGFSTNYLQRALNTSYLISTAVDLPTVELAARNLGDQHPLALFVGGDEIIQFQKTFVHESNKAHDSNVPYFLEISPNVNQNHVHCAAFAAESLINYGMENLFLTIQTLNNWLDLDSAYQKAEEKDNMKTRLWARSFIPLSCVENVKSPSESDGDNQLRIRFFLKRSFLRSILKDFVEEISFDFQ